MTGKLAQYLARYRGEEYAASPMFAGDMIAIRLYSASPRDGFDDVGERFVMGVPMAECDAVSYVTTVTEWSGMTCQVIGERTEDLLVEYLQGDVTAAAAAGFERLERGVWARWVRREETTGTRLSTTMLKIPDPEAR